MFYHAKKISFITQLNKKLFSLLTFDSNFYTEKYETVWISFLKFPKNAFIRKIRRKSDHCTTAHKNSSVEAWMKALAMG